MSFLTADLLLHFLPRWGDFGHFLQVTYCTPWSIMVILYSSSTPHHSQKGTGRWLGSLPRLRPHQLTERADDCSSLNTNRTWLYLLGIRQVTALYATLHRTCFGGVFPPCELAASKSRFISFMRASSDPNTNWHFLFSRYSLLVKFNKCKQTCFFNDFNLWYCVGWEAPYTFTDPYLTNCTWSKLKNVKKLVTSPVGLERSGDDVVCTFGVQSCMAN